MKPNTLLVLALAFAACACESPAKKSPPPPAFSTAAITEHTNRSQAAVNSAQASAGNQAAAINRQGQGIKGVRTNLERIDAKAILIREYLNQP